MEQVRCTNCRGMKQVAKLGGMMGDCNGCKGTGLMNPQDRVILSKVETPEPSLAEIKSEVAAAIPWVDKEAEDLPVIQEVPSEGELTVEKVKAAVSAVKESPKPEPKRVIHKLKK